MLMVLLSLLDLGWLGDKGGFMASIIITGGGELSIDKIEEMRKFIRNRELLSEERERALEPYRLRAEAIGVTLEELKNMTVYTCMSIESQLSLLESLLEPKPTLSSLADLVEVFEEEDCGLSAADIRKQLKYEKNPMRIKQLNKMLCGMRKNSKKK